MPTIADQLAAHVATLDFDHLGSDRVVEVEELFADYLGVALAGSRTEPARVVAQYQSTYNAGPAEASVIGGGVRISAHGAAFANAVSSHGVELDDVDRLALFHFSPTVVSAALAVAEARDLSGRELILAIACGCDVVQALSIAMNPSLRNRGFHTTPVCGVFGAAAAASRLLGSKHQQVVSSFGIAGAHASGLMEMYGPSMQKRLNPGPAAHNGVVSARLAALGFEGASTIFDGERGVFKAFADETSTDAMLARLREGGPVEVEYKYYACARPIHNAIDCALAVRPDIVDRLNDIVSITLARHPDWAAYHNVPEPSNYHEAQVSVNHATAVALATGTAGLAQFDEPYLHDPQIRRLVDSLVIVPDPDLNTGVSCHLTVELGDGSVHESEIDHPKGSLANPLTTLEHEQKFRELAAQALPQGSIEILLSELANLEELESVAGLMSIVREAAEAHHSTSGAAL